jgi:hypothetical protein
MGKAQELIRAKGVTKRYLENVGKYHTNRRLQGGSISRSFDEEMPQNSAHRSREWTDGLRTKWISEERYLQMIMVRIFEIDGLLWMSQDAFIPILHSIVGIGDNQYFPETV